MLIQIAQCPLYYAAILNTGLVGTAGDKWRFKKMMLP